MLMLSDPSSAATLVHLCPLRYSGKDFNKPNRQDDEEMHYLGRHEAGPQRSAAASQAQQGFVGKRAPVGIPDQLDTAIPWTISFNTA